MCLSCIPPAIFHLLYARFINHFLFDLGLVPEKEPFKKLLAQVGVSGVCPGGCVQVGGYGWYVQVGVSGRWVCPGGCVQCYGHVYVNREVITLCKICS